MATQASTAAQSLPGAEKELRRDARRRKRLKVSLLAHIRPFDPRFEEVEETAEVSGFFEGWAVFPDLHASLLRRHASADRVSLWQDGASYPQISCFCCASGPPS